AREKSRCQRRSTSSTNGGRKVAPSMVSPNKWLCWCMKSLERTQSFSSQRSARDARDGETQEAILELSQSCAALSTKTLSSAPNVASRMSRAWEMPSEADLRSRNSFCSEVTRTCRGTALVCTVMDTPEY